MRLYGHFTHSLLDKFQNEKILIAASVLTTVGLTYKATDSLNLALHRKSASDSKNKKWKYGETAVSGVYTVAPGLTTSLTYTDSKLTDNAGKSNSGKYTRVEVRVAF